MSNERYTFWDQVYRNGKVDQKHFSLCFSRQDFVDPEGTPAGAMTIGGYDSRLHKSRMVFAKELSKGGFYSVHVKKIFLRKGGGESASFSSGMTASSLVQLEISEADLNARGVIIDSGTTDTYFMSTLGPLFQEAWKEMTGKKYANKGMTFKPEELLKLPTIIIQLQGASKEYYDRIYGDDIEPQHMVGLAGELEPDSPYDVILAVPASHYMEYDSDTDLYTPRVYLDERSGSVLGANAMQGHDVFFNMEDNYIGFAESDCNFAASVNDPRSEPMNDASSKAEVEIEVKPEVTYDDYYGKEERIYGTNDDEGVEYPKDDVESVSASWACTTARCQVYFGLALIVIVAQVVGGVSLYRRYRASRRGILLPMNNELDFDEDGEVEIMAAERNPIV